MKKMVFNFQDIQDFLFEKQQPGQIAEGSQLYNQIAEFLSWQQKLVAL
jgi:hypothetical protein